MAAPRPPRKVTAKVRAADAQYSDAGLLRFMRSSGQAAGRLAAHVRLGHTGNTSSH
jgi:hypothetical protein